MKAKRLTISIPINTINYSIGKSANKILTIPLYEPISIISDQYWKCCGELFEGVPYVGFEFSISKLEIKYIIVEDEK